jgi:hypothetical protein
VETPHYRSVFDGASHHPDQSGQDVHDEKLKSGDCHG